MHRALLRLALVTAMIGGASCGSTPKPVKPVKTGKQAQKDARAQLSEAPLLTVANLLVAYGGIPAVRDVSITVERGVIVAVDDFAETDLASENLGEQQRVKRQQQPIILGELVAEDETDGNELGRLAPAFRRHALDGLKAGL